MDKSVNEVLLIRPISPYIRKLNMFKILHKILSLIYKFSWPQSPIMHACNNYAPRLTTFVTGFVKRYLFTHNFLNFATSFIACNYNYLKFFIVLFVANSSLISAQNQMLWCLICLHSCEKGIFDKTGLISYNCLRAFKLLNALLEYVSDCSIREYPLQSMFRNECSIIKEFSSTFTRHNTL